ncbi:MAG: hypothetical protein EB023_06545 [Flavobacteriia bacterium]|nr:hypothetical protein [Flavobacteriia bacterium]
MKNVFFLSLAVLMAVLFACNMASGDDYDNLAVDMCACINKSSSNISPTMKNAIINSNGDQEKMMEGIQATMGDNPEQAMTDAIALESMGKETEKCISSLEKKYDKIYTTDKDEVVQQKLLNALEKSADCKFTYAILKIGMNSKE